MKQREAGMGEIEKISKKYEISWILAGYCLKSNNSLKRDDTEKYRSSITQAHLSQI